jgi:hypothetical protein
MNALLLAGGARALEVDATAARMRTEENFMVGY